MSWWKAMLGAGCVAPLAGCNLFQLAAHNLVNEPVQYTDECSLDSRLREEARLAWREVCRQYPERTFTLEFADGFKDGYADHLQHGGPPRAPAVPPLKYRRSRYFTPEGSLRVKDYLCGAKYGAEVAAATGYRAFLTVPALLDDRPPDRPLPITVLPPPPDPGAEPAAGDKPAPLTPVGPLPAPKPLGDDKPPVVPKAAPPQPGPVPLGTPKPADPPPFKIDGPPAVTPPTAPPVTPPTTPPVTPPAGPTRPGETGTGLPVIDLPATPKMDAPPAGAVPPRPSPLRPGETGTGLPAIDLPFPDFIAPPPAASPPIRRQSGSDAEPGGVIPAAAPPPAVPIPPPPDPAPTVGPPPVRVPAAAPPAVRPPAARPQGN